MKTIATILLCAFSLVSIVLVTPTAQAEETDQATGLKKGTLTIPDLQVSIPGLTFGSDPSEWLGEYIAGIYKYATSIVGILAAVVLMIAGVIWLTAGGNASKVTEAKAWITAALTGLVLALTSFTILNIVNPELTVFKSLGIKPLATVHLADSTFSIKNGSFVANKVYSGSDIPLPDDKRMVDPRDYNDIRNMLTDKANRTLNIEKNMVDALLELETHIITDLPQYTNEARITGSRGGISSVYIKTPTLKINSLSDGVHDLAGTGDSTHLHGRAADITGIENATDAEALGTWWISQGQGRRFIWEGDHLHLDLGYPLGIRDEN